MKCLMVPIHYYSRSIFNTILASISVKYVNKPCCFAKDYLIKILLLLCPYAPSDHPEVGLGIEEKQAVGDFDHK